MIDYLFMLILLLFMFILLFKVFRFTAYYLNNIIIIFGNSY